jgi:hypothetical protein
MDSKKRILATLAGTVVCFFMGWLVYGMLLMDFMASNAGTATGVMKGETEMVWWALILGTLMQAYLLVYVFGKVGNITTFGSGFQLGLMLGLIIGFAFDLSMYGTSNVMNLTATIVDPIAGGVINGIAGGVIGVVLGRK